MNTQIPSPLLRVYTIFLAAATFFLVIAGGAVTSTGSGLAVPDWPLSFGQYFPPMVGGVFFEHGHRMVATVIGFLTVVLALWLWRAPVSPTLKKAGWGAVGLVLLQGVLGGVTVLLKLPALTSVAHACLGQIFFTWMVCLAWLANTAGFEQNADLTPAAAKVFRLARLTLIFIFLQLIAGAIYRHTGKALHVHFLGAALVVIHAILLLKRTGKTPEAPEGVRILAIVLNEFVVLQLVLGFFSWRMPRPMITTAHQSLGALIFATAALAALQSTRRRVPSSQPSPVQRPGEGA